MAPLLGSTASRTLGKTYCDLIVCQIDILHTQPHAIHQPHARAVQQGRHKSVRAMHVRQELPDLGTGAHHGEPLRSLRPHQPVEVAERLLHDMLIQENQSTACLILGTSALSQLNCRVNRMAHLLVPRSIADPSEIANPTF